MSPETDKALANILQKGLELAEKTGHFIVDQTTDVVQQFIYWRLCMHSIYVLVSGIVLYILYRWIKQVWKWGNEETDYDGGALMFALIILIISIAGAGIFFISNLLDVIKLIVAPKVYLIEYAVELVKNVNVSQKNGGK